jgi:glycerophosphoryl diester phosphodiesterase
VSVFGTVIAHRAGNDLRTLAGAVGHVDVVEADVHLFHGRLEVRHAKSIGPLPILWERWYLLDRRAPRVVLAEVLEAASPGITLMLDLKGIDPRLPGEVMRAVDRWLAGRRLIVCSRTWRALEIFRGVAGVETLHSVGSRRQLHALLRRYPRRFPGGVSIDRRLLDPVVTAALRERTDRVWSWVVDDRETARTLASWGVTGFISDAPHALHPG